MAEEEKATMESKAAWMVAAWMGRRGRYYGRGREQRRLDVWLSERRQRESDKAGRPCAPPMLDIYDGSLAKRHRSHTIHPSSPSSPSTSSSTLQRTKTCRRPLCSLRSKAVSHSTLCKHSCDRVSTMLPRPGTSLTASAAA